MTPAVRTTLAPAGRRPVLRQQVRHRQKVSVAAALCRSPGRGHVRLAYEVFPDRFVDGFGYAAFLRERVVRRVRGPIVLVHDGATLHHGDWMDGLTEDVGRLEVHELPPYAPELNPVEPLWNWAKGTELANFLPADVDQLTVAAAHVMDAAADDQRRLQSFFDAVPLSW
jgi:transposase